MVEIREVKTLKEKRQFLNFPLKMYKKNRCYVPTIYMDEKKIFSSKNPYYEQAEAKWFLAFKDNKVVGRIGAIKQNAANEKWNQKRIRFTRFDCIDDQEVADKLFEAVENYAKETKMDEIVGPLGFSDLEREGLLIEGFEYLSTFGEQYNYSYYQKLIENCGYGKEIDWLEHRLRYLPGSEVRFERITSKILKKLNLHIVSGLSTKKIIDKYGDQIFDALEKTYDQIYGTVPFTPGIIKSLIDGFKVIVAGKFIGLIVDENDKLVAFSICWGGFGHVLQETSGHMTPLTIIRLLHNTRHPKYFEMGLIGVEEKYQKLGVGAALIGGSIELLKEGKIKFAETNLNLEDNEEILAQWKNFDANQHKRRRCFIKKI